MAATFPDKNFLVKNFVPPSAFLTSGRRAHRRRVSRVHIYLQAWRKRTKGLTQPMVAEVLGVEAPAVSKWETGMVSPRLDQLEALAKLYGASHAADLLLPPPREGFAERYRRASAVLADIPPEAADNWLTNGEMIANGFRQFKNQPHLLREPERLRTPKTRGKTTLHDTGDFNLPEE